jgi:hypothetical protein
VKPRESEGGNNPSDSIYTSDIGACFHALPKHMQRLLGHHIPEIALPENFDCTEPSDIIVATDGSVLFGVGYDSCIISTKDEHMLLQGGGTDDGAPLYMTSYRSKFRLVRDNEAAVKRWYKNLTSYKTNGAKRYQQRSNGWNCTITGKAGHEKNGWTLRPTCLQTR